MRSSLKLGRLFGIEIGINYTWLFAFLLVAWSLADGYFRYSLPVAPARFGVDPLLAVIDYLAYINLLLGAFNLIPGFPLDGGRVLRSLVWGTTHSLRRATVVASVVGQGFGWLLILAGLARFLSGDPLGGLWTAFIGWVLNGAAEGRRQ